MQNMNKKLSMLIALFMVLMTASAGAVSYTHLTLPTNA